MIRPIIKSIALIILTASCSYDNFEEYYSEYINSCDTINVSYNTTIRPILDRNCLECHFAGNGTGVTLATYEQVKDVADKGWLLGAIKHEPGYSPMPKGANKLDPCTINKIQAWINDGSLNN